MAKRSNFKRNNRDLYPTPLKGAVPLIKTVENFYDPTVPETVTKFIEPFAGDGALTAHLCSSDAFECIYQSDIEPAHMPNTHIKQHGYEDTPLDVINEADVIISNPPWVNTKASGQQLFKIIEHFSALKPTVLLLDGGFAFNVGSAPYMEYCHSIIPVGRLKWIPNSKHTGTEDCAWFTFDQTMPMQTSGPVFLPRGKYS